LYNLLALLPLVYHPCQRVCIDRRLKLMVIQSVFGKYKSKQVGNFHLQKTSSQFLSLFINHPEVTNLSKLLYL